MPLFVPVELPAARGMRVTLDFEGFLDGAPIPDSRMENVTVVLGTGQLMPAAENAVYGHKAGEDFRFDFTYPAEFRVPELSGKTAQFAIALHTVEQKQTVPLDDAFAGTLGFDSVDALKESIREKKRRSHEANADRIAGAALLDMAGANLTAELNGAVLDQNAERDMNALRDRLRRSKMTMELYCKAGQTTPDSAGTCTPPHPCTACKDICQVQRDISPADSDGDTIWIGCEKSTRKNTVVRTCVSAYSWEALAYLALNKKIVLDLTPCGECENDVCAEHLRAVLTRLVEFFGQPLFEARFTLAYELDDAPFHVKEYSRREMMEQVTSGSKKGTKQLLRMLPGLRSEDESSQDFRLLLHQYTKQLKAVSETPLRYGYHLPNFTQKCFACGRCEKSCRSGAIKFEDLPDGQTRAVITPWKCSECGVCVAACSNGGLDGLKLRQLTSLGPVSVYKCTKTLCKDCGKPIAPNCADGICSVCRIKRRTKKRQEEAAARAKERQAEREAKKEQKKLQSELAAEMQPSQPAQSAAAPEAGAAPAPTESTC